MLVWRSSGFKVLNESGFKNTSTHTHTNKQHMNKMHSYIRAHEHSYARTSADDIHGQWEGSRLRNIILKFSFNFYWIEWFTDSFPASGCLGLPRAATSLQPPLGIGGIL